MKQAPHEYVVDPPGSGLLAVGQYILRRLNGNRTATLLAYFGFVFLKVLSVSLWRMPTALTIMRLTPLPVIVAGSTLSALPIAALTLFASVLYLWVSGYWRERWVVVLGDGSSATMSPPHTWSPSNSIREWAHSRRIALLMVLISGFFAMLLAPAAILAVGAVSAIAIGIGARLTDYVRSRRGSLDMKEDPWRPRIRWTEARSEVRLADDFARQRIRMFWHRWAISRGFLVLIAILVVASYSQTLEAVWLDHVRLTVVAPPGSPEIPVSQIGYVVSDDNGLVYVIQSGSRNLYIYQSSSIVGRTSCAVRYSYPFSNWTYGVETVFGLGADRYPKKCSG
jgi:hypothetical protein